MCMYNICMYVYIIKPSLSQSETGPGRMGRPGQRFTKIFKNKQERNYLDVKN